MTQWWPGDGNTNDIQGPTFENGTAVNGATFAAGLVQDAFSFDGANDYFQFPSNVADFGAAPFTVDLWMYSNINGSGTYIIGRSHPNDGLGWDFRLHEQKLHLVGTNGWPAQFNWESDQSLTPNAWHHIAVAAGKSQISVYIDGVLKGTPARSAISSAPNPLRLGFTSNFGGSPFDGRIDEVEIFSRELTANEIMAIYNAGSAGKCRDCTPPPPDMVQWWPGDGDALTSRGRHLRTALISTGPYGPPDWSDRPSILPAPKNILRCRPAAMSGSLEATRLRLIYGLTSE